MPFTRDTSAQRTSATTTPRLPHDECWGFQGIGALQVRLVRRHSFEGTTCHEIRGARGAPRLYLARPALPDRERVVGLDRLQVAARVLWQLVRDLEQVCIPARAPDDTGLATVDGETIEVVTRSDAHAVASFAWKQGRCPAGWKPLALLIEPALASFATLAVHEDEPDEGGPPLV